MASTSSTCLGRNVLKKVMRMKDIMRHECLNINGTLGSKII